MLNVVWAMNIVHRLKGTPPYIILAKNIARDIPIIISGITKGIYDMNFTYFFTLKLNHFIAIAPKVAITTDINDELIAMSMLLKTASHKSGEFLNNSIYHFNEKPPQLNPLELLNESTININIGM